MKPVTVYSTDSCIYCKMAKDFFKENNVEYTEKDVAHDAAALDEMFNMTGQRGVPVIKIGEEIVIGFDKVTIKNLLELQ